jgi:hypothetical protein
MRAALDTNPHVDAEGDARRLLNEDVQPGSAGAARQSSIPW